jgi:DNA-binding CsgD family transcriptional regulator
LRDRPRIALVGATPWLVQGLAAALAEDTSWQLVAWPGGEPADAYVVHAHTEAEANGLQAALPPQAPVLWLGEMPAAAAADGSDRTDRADRADRADRTARPHRGDAATAPAATLHDADRSRPTAHLPADAGAGQLRAALAAVLAGLSVRVAGAAAWPTRPAGVGAAASYADEAIEALTTRELEVFELLAKGLSNRDIAGVLGISAHTAKFHVAQILAKVGAATRAEAVAIGLRLGLIGL